MEKRQRPKEVLTVPLNASIRELKGIGEKRAALYEKIGIRTVGDLLGHYPRIYEDWSAPTLIRNAVPGEPCCIRGWAVNSPTEHRVRKGMTLYKFRVTDGERSLQVTLFNNPYAAAKVRRDQEILLYGTVVSDGRRAEMTSPQIESPAAARIRPIYPRTEGLTARMIEGNVAAALERLERVALPEILPEEIVAREGLCDRMTAIRHIHFPPDHAAIAEARRRLVFEELFVLQLGLLRLKSRSRRLNGAVLHRDHTPDYVAGLPFALTGAQRRAIADCIGDMQGLCPMSRLVQGDVGSGKTAVAAGVAYSLIREGWQAAMMAPTEILAEQHAASLQKLLGDTVRVGLLTGSMTAANKRRMQETIAAGEVDFVVGTHALISDNVQFAKLGLVVTDEQHRFGVAQRARLAAKGQDPHLLVMSATPIPRTLALILYGDLDVSVLDELPPGRQPIETYAIGTDKRERAYGYIRKHLDAGRQGFIVCPLVEEGEEPSDLQSATALFDELRQGPFRGYSLGLLHGRMKGAEKEKIMTAFAAGEIQLLVSTTVIEVGVDVPNAVIMAIENAERFGLAQLHQLRGRVGRGVHRSTCILITDHRGEETRRRLGVMCATNDGFKIADEDLKLRGPGDFFGNRQHGLPQLKIADLLEDMPMLQRAQSGAAALLDADPNLMDHPALWQAVEHLFQQVGEQGMN
ncbi:MAG: ATP-dependent DNA helicase RecG [Clostridia bacterium]|nr:ATP-dependent DNA helicase RecG [Clostridia bacterium]